MTNLKEMTQDIINAIYGKQDAVAHLTNERTLDSHFDAIDRFEQGINILAMNNVGDRYKEVATDNGSKIVRVVGRDKADKRELWNGRLQYTMYKSESEKYLPKKSASTASIKVKNFSKKSTYIPTPERVDIDYSTLKPNSSLNYYSVVSYRIFKKAVVLEVVNPDSENTAIQNRELPENNNLPLHIVFRYEPLTKTGQINPYDGLTQLKSFLKKQKCVTTTKPATLRDALESLVGNTVDFGVVYPYNYTTKSDNLTVYSVFGEFDTIEEQFSEQNYSFEDSTEYTEVDDDCLGYESVKPEVYANINLKNNRVISYDCHKEFLEPIPLVYNHIGYIFD